MSARHATAAPRRSAGRALLLTALLSLAACGAPRPTETEIRSADFGLPPRDPLPAIVAHFAPLLPEPETARFELSPPVRGSYGKAITNLAGPRRLHFAWLVVTRIDAANGYGGRAHPHLVHCWFRGDTLVQVVDPAELVRGAEISGPLPEADGR